MARLRNNRIEAFHPEILGSDRIREMHVMRDGSMLVSTAGGGMLEVRGENIKRYTMRDGLPSDRIWAIEDDGSGEAKFGMRLLRRL